MEAMALIEIDGLPFYKMVDLSMANCECHKQMVYRMVYNPKNEPLHLQSSGVPFLDQLPKNSALVSQGKPPPCRDAETYFQDGCSVICTYYLPNISRRLQLFYL